MSFLLLGAHLKREDLSAEVRAIELEDIFLSAVNFDSSRGAADRETVLRISEIRQRLIQREIFVAFRYGQSFHRDSDAVSGSMGEVGRWRELLTRWRGHVEITTKIAPRARATAPDRAAASGGADYLRRLSESRSTPLDDSLRSTFEGAMQPIAKKSRWQHRPDGGWEFVVLAERGSLSQLGTISQKLRGETDVPFLISAPWPLEAFADER